MSQRTLYLFLSSISFILLILYMIRHEKEWKGTDVDKINPNISQQNFETKIKKVTKFPAVAPDKCKETATLYKGTD